MRTTLRKMAALAIVLTLLSCSGAARNPYSMGTNDRDADQAQFVMRSTVQLLEKIHVRVDMADGTSIENDLKSSGSGVVVAVDTVRDRSLVLTAWHVCNTYPVGYTVEGAFGAKLVVMSDVSLVVTVDGRELAREVVYEDRDHDVCVVEVAGHAGEPATLADDLPPHGARLMSSAAPSGLWGEYNVSVRDGRFNGLWKGPDLVLQLSGTDEIETTLNEFVYWSIPGTPGVSGGGVYYKGSLLSIHSVGYRGTTEGWGPNIKHIRRAVAEARAGAWGVHTN